MSFVFNITAPTAPVCANDATLAAIKSAVGSPFANAIIANGTIAQCSPNMTKTCQANPSTKPKIIGLNPCNASKPLPKASEARFITGPITRKPRGIEMIAVKNGVKKSFTTSGIIFFNWCSKNAANAVMAIIGITEDP